MLPPAARLRRRAEFAATTRGGRRAGRGALVVHLATPPEAGKRARAGFTVSKAVGTAVVRNRVRRRLRHLVAARLATLPAGADLVVRALPAAAGRSYHDLGRDLDQALATATAPRAPKHRSSAHRASKQHGGAR